MRMWLILLVLAFISLAAGCGGSGEDLVAKDGPEDTVEKDTLRDAQTAGLEGTLTSVTFGEGFLWVTDLGDYACDDTLEDPPLGPALFGVLRQSRRGIP